MKKIAIMIGLVALAAGASSAIGTDNGAIQLTSSGKIERTQVAYDCGAQGKFAVTYVNADPNFLAIVPVPGQKQPIVFVSVISGSGARYAAGKYVWWTKGNQASLYDSTEGDNAAPSMTCTANR